MTYFFYFNYKLWRTIFLFLLLISGTLSAESQTPGIYTLHLTDKEGTGYTLDHPEEFLSPRALQRREQQEIPVTYEDLPVSQVYLDSLQSLGMEISCCSRWFNTVTAHISDTALIDTLPKLGFINKVRLVKPDYPRKSTREKWLDTFSVESTPTYLKQLSLLNGLALHERGYRGKNMLIAVLDAGFFHVNTLPAFDSLRAAGRIAGTRDIVDPPSGVWEDHAHGMYVLSILAGNIPGELLGAAPEASYWLIRTEDAGSEYPVEEEYWLAGAELADSVGADIISSSLGYFTFDDARFDHSYADMDGLTTVAARAAVMAARRGMIVVNSAGNERNNPWYYIITPADADSILAVGAVDTLLQPTYFTSAGPAADGRVKPDVAALGRDVFIQLSDSTVGQGSGTSFSAPLLSGMTACLWQAFPTVKAQKIIQTIRECSSHYDQPDDLTGYGIPDMMKPFDILSIQENTEEKNALFVYPNPFAISPTIGYTCEKGGKMSLAVYTLTGTRILFKEIIAHAGLNLLPVDLSRLPSGPYLLEVYHQEKRTETHIIKIE
jgi:subtilisin family serine protease